jgi:hypothetical protein
MLKDLVKVGAVPGYRLALRFEDGTEGEVNVTDLVPFIGVFAELKDPKRFSEARLDPELGTVVWPNGADLDPDVLYAAVKGQPIRLGNAAAK